MNMCLIKILLSIFSVKLMLCFALFFWRCKSHRFGWTRSETQCWCH